MGVHGGLDSMGCGHSGFPDPWLSDDDAAVAHETESSVGPLPAAAAAAAVDPWSDDRGSIDTAADPHAWCPET